MSFYDDASLVFLPSGGAGKDGKAYSMKPVPEYGSELVTNGDFATDSDWIKGTGWTISGGTANCDGTQTGNTLLYQNIGHSSNTLYRLQFTISNYVSGTIDFALDNPFFGAANSNGTFVFDITPSSVGNFIVRADENFVGSIDNVSVKEITTSGDFTFSRGSNLTATRVDSNGLIEKGRENLLLQSNQFDTTWTTSNTSVTSGQSGYDGSSDAYELSKTSGVAYSYIRQVVSTGGVQTASVYAKAGTLDLLGLYLYDNNTNPYVTINLSTGALHAKRGGSSEIDYEIEDKGSGWYRITYTFNANVSVYYLYPDWSSTNTGNIYIQDAQLEQGLVATEYIESGATKGKAGLLENEPRFNYPIGGGSPHLLLEPNRTNVWEYSEYLDYSFASVSSVTITQNTTETLSPEGLYNATKLEGVESWSLRDFIAGTDTGTWTVSCYIKAVNPSRDNTFRLSVGGNNYSDNLTATSEWQRFDLTITNGGATAAGILRDTSANDADLYIYGMQVEQGSYPTSYIPNHSGGSVSRELELVQTADVSSLNLIGQNEGTFFLDFEYTGFELGEAYNWIALESENGEERVLIYKNANSPDLLVYLSANSSMVFVKSIAAIAANTRYKLAFKYSDGDQAIYLNGIQKHTSTHSYTRGSDLSRLKFNESNNPASCRVHQAIVLTSGWSNDDLEKLTSGI